MESLKCALVSANRGMCQLLQSDHLVTSGELSLRKHLLSAALSELVDCCHGQASRVCEYFLRAKEDDSSLKCWLWTMHWNSHIIL